MWRRFCLVVSRFRRNLHAGERVRAVVFEVQATGNRVRVVLSRTRPQLVQRLFEQEIPEIGEEIISIQSISREPGYRSKVAVSSVDSQIDPIAVCVGYRGSRIKAVREELAGEHIDVVRFSDDPEVLIPNALQPRGSRAGAALRYDRPRHRSGARRSVVACHWSPGQNVRLGSKLCGWDIEIMTGSELEDQIERAVTGFSQIEGVTEEIAQSLVEQGYLSYDDLSVIEPDQFMEMSGLSAEDVDRVVDVAEKMAEEAEEAAAEERRVRREREQNQGDAAAAVGEETVEGETEAETPPTESDTPASEPETPDADEPAVATEQPPQEAVSESSDESAETTPENG